MPEDKGDKKDSEELDVWTPRPGEMLQAYLERVGPYGPVTVLSITERPNNGSPCDAEGGVDHEPDPGPGDPIR